MGRFINADAFVSTGQGLVGNNMFAYCNNNPVNCVDQSGQSAAALAGCTIMGAISGANSYMLGCFLSGESMELNGLLFSAGIGAINGLVGGIAGTVSVGQKVVYSVAAGYLSAAATSGSYEDKMIAFACTAVSTFAGSLVDTHAVNELGEFVTSFAVTAYTSGTGDALSVCLQQMDSNPIPPNSSTNRSTYALKNMPCVLE